MLFKQAFSLIYHKMGQVDTPILLLKIDKYSYFFSTKGLTMEWNSLLCHLKNIL